MDPYLDLLKQCLTASLYDESAYVSVQAPARAGLSPRAWWSRWLLGYLQRRHYAVYQRRPFDAQQREQGMDWPAFGYTMVGHKRLDCLRTCIEDVLARNVPGDLLEAGVWRGGAAIFMRAVLRHHGVTDRKLWLADSFAGMPRPVHAQDRARPEYDQADCAYLTVTLEQVQANFRRFGLLDDRVQFLKGWFKDTLPTAPIGKLAVLHADGDLYESTMDVLSSMYHHLSPGGYVIIDDYHTWPTCQAAVDEFRQARGIAAPLHAVDASAAYWQVPS